ncbi:hypothetical protein ACFWE5_07215 [Cellulosimicrobium funkei]|uniref:hypothetical protein n=1 Tax=Cellulosimicrobium funkei TaxID=264251 RepID=UPI0036582FE8
MIREQRSAGGTIRGIARDVGASRNAVRRALAPGARERYHRRSSTEEVELAVRDVLADHPLLTVEEIGVLISWPRSRRTLSTLVARLRPEYLDRDRIASGAMAAAALAIGSMRAAPLAAGMMRVGTTLGGGES